MMEILIGIGTTIFIGIWIWIGRELYNAPLLDDEDMKDAFKDMEGEDLTPIAPPIYVRFPYEIGFFFLRSF